VFERGDELLEREIRAGVRSLDRPMNAGPFDLIVATMIETKSILRYGVQVR